MEVTTWSGSNNTGGISTDAYEYLQTGHEIKPDGDNPVTRAEYIAVDDDRLDDVLAAIQAAQSACEGQITSISGRVTTAESSISGLDTRVTALEESGGGGGSGGTTNYNELTNIPTINGVTVKGNLSAQNLGLANAVDIPTPMVSYGTCTTAAATAEKVVTLVNADGWTLKTGCIIAIRHANTNSANNPTLNVNGSGAKPIMYNTSTITTSNLSYAGAAMRQTVYCYNGTSWAWISHGIDNNTTYSSKAAASGGTATSLVTTGEKYTWNAKTSNTGTVTSVSVKMNGASKGTVTSSGTIDLGTVITSHQSLDACAKTADLGGAAYEKVRDANAVTHCGWVNHDTDMQYVPNMAFLAFWNGAHVASGKSNLAYCNKGAFGTIVTKSEQNYITTGTGTALKSGDNIDTLSDGVYYSASNSVSLSLAGTLPNWGSGLGGFRLEQFGRSGGNFKQQILVSNWHVEDGQFLMRFANSSTLTWGSWFVYGGTKLT